MKYEIKISAAFKKELKYAKKQGKDISLLDEVVTMLANGEKLPENIMITSFPETGKITGNVISSRIGC